MEFIAAQMFNSLNELIALAPTIILLQIRNLIKQIFFFYFFFRVFCFLMTIDGVEAIKF
jgi:hypothetical protein